MSTLTERYVHAVTRRLPESGREDVGRELRATIADAVEAADPGTDPAVAERTAIVALGDPERLAAGYRGRPTYLIGPDLYPIWARVTRLLLGVVPAIAGAVELVSALVETPIPSIGSIIAGVLSTAFFAAAQVAFWTVLGFAIAERNGTDADQLRGRAWKPEDLAEPQERHVRWGEVVAQVGGIGALLALFAFAHNPNITINGTPTLLFTQTFWNWRWLLVVALAAMVVLGVMTGIRGRWTWNLAHANLALQAAFALPAIWLLQSDRLLTPEVVNAMSGSNPGTWSGIASTLIGLGAAWNVLDAYRKAARSR
jgi:hypothetical protein